jgi:hypothetical protein
LVWTWTTWKLTGNVQYSTASEYKLQFFSLVESSLNKIIWKAWATPNAKNHTLLVLQNRLWMADRLRRRGWDNCGPCQLCKQTEENHDHLFVYCRFTVRIWKLLKDWLGLQGIYPRLWAGLSIQEWWSSLAEGSSPHKKGLSSLALLAVWEIWKEWNARVFHHKSSSSFAILDKIKCETWL